MIRISWDKYETALLIEAFWNIEKNKSSRQSILRQLSDDLRKLAVNRGYIIDDTFRNYNGMCAMYGSIKCTFFPESGAMHSAKIFEEIANIYIKDKNQFDLLLQEAHSMLNKGMEEKMDNKNSFRLWLEQQNTKVDPFNLLIIFEDASEYALRHNISKKAFWDINSSKDFNLIRVKLSGDRIFKFNNRGLFASFEKHGKLYSSFLKEKEANVVIKQDSDDDVQVVDDAENSLSAPEEKEFVVDFNKNDTPTEITVEEKREMFYDWMLSVGVSESTAKIYLQSIEFVSDWCKSREYCNRHLYEISEIRELLSISSDLFTDPGFVDKDNAYNNIHSVAFSKYVGFLKNNTCLKTVSYDKAESKNNPSQASVNATVLMTYDFNQRPSLSYTKPEDFEYYDKKYSGFSSWRDLFCAFVGALYVDKTAIILKLAELPECTYISLDKTKLRAPGKATEDIYVETNKSATSFVTSIRQLLDLCSIEYNKLVIHFWGNGEKSEVNVAGTSQSSQPAYSVQNRRDAAPTDFSKENFVSVLMSRFCSGMLYDSIDYDNFRETYEDMFDEKLAFSDEELKSRLSFCGIEYKNRLFPADGIIDQSTAQKIFAHIDNLISSGSKIVYYKAILTDLSDVLQYCYSLTDENMLKAYLEFVEPNKYFYFNNYLAAELNVKIDHATEIKEFMLSAGKPLLYEEIYDGLPHIAKDIISRELHGNRHYINNGRESYYHIQLLDISAGDIQFFVDCFFNQIKDNGFANWSFIYQELCATNHPFLEKNCYLSSLGIRNALAFALSLNFMFSGNIISDRENPVDTADVFALYAKNNAPFSAEDLQDFVKALDCGPSVYWNALARESVRVSRDLFVARDTVEFNVNEIDKALATYLTDGYMFVKDINSFLLFPYVGYEWNEFLLESYLNGYSRNYQLINNGTSMNNVAGAVVRKNGKYNDFFDICVHAIADSDVELTKPAALNYLVESNLITRRSYSSIGDVLTKARELRNRRK